MNALNSKTRKWLLLAVILLLAGSGLSQGQSVAVTMSLDTNQLAVGQTTKLHVLAQVIPGLQPSSAQIFSWCVNVLNTNGAVASANYGAMLKTASDNDPQTSSTGTADGPNRRGIYDTFLNLPGAGVTNAVELMSIPVTGAAGGTTRFLTQAGTGVPMDSDFLVFPNDGGDFYTGGDYSAAVADLTVIGSAPPSTLRLKIARLANNGRPGGTLQLTFTPSAGYTYTVESLAAFGKTNSWQALPGAPHNSGTVIVTNTGRASFYRVHATLP